MMTEEW